MARETHRLGKVEISFEALDWQRARRRKRIVGSPSGHALAVEAVRKLARLIEQGKGPKNGRNSGTLKVCGVRVRYTALDGETS